MGLLARAQAGASAPAEPEYNPVTDHDWAVAYEFGLLTQYQDEARTIPCTQTTPIYSATDGSGNDRHASQATSTARPTLTTVDGVVCAGFDGGDWLQALGFTLTQPNHVIVIGKVTELIATHAFVDSALTSARHYIRRESASSLFRAYAGNNVNGDSGDSNWHTFEFEVNGANSIFRVDAVDHTGTTQSHNLNGITLGAAFDANAKLIGCIRAVFVADAILDAAALTQIRDYYNGILP